MEDIEFMFEDVPRRFPNRRRIYDWSLLEDIQSMSENLEFMIGLYRKK